jgi:phage tail-like protein
MANFDNIYPYITSAFKVEIEGVQEASFKECSGLEAETEVLSFEEGGVNDFVHKLPVRTKHPNVVLKRGITEFGLLWDWYQKVSQGKIERKNISIVMFNSEGEEVKRWSFDRAYPVKWSGPGLKADENSVAVETLELVHEGMKSSK